MTELLNGLDSKEEGCDGVIQNALEVLENLIDRKYNKEFRV